MAFWIKVDVRAKGHVEATTYETLSNGQINTGNALRTRTGTTVSQALRALAASMVHATAETVGQKKSEAA